MKRTIVALAALSALAGCQAHHRTATAPPARVADRLATVARSRIAPDGSPISAGALSSTSASWYPMAQSDRPPATARQVAMTGVRTRPATAESWALVDLGDQTSGDDEWSDSGYSIDDAPGEGEFSRRPPLDSFWETVKRDVRHMPDDLWRDTKRVYTNPTNLIILGTAYGGSLALQQTGPDHTVEDHFRGGHHHFNKGWREAFAAAGNPGTHFGLAGLWYLIGQQTLDEKTYEVGKTLFSALIINGLTVAIGQTATWDRGPNGELGTFPSGHTSSSFTVASVMHEAYGHAVGIPLYGLATLVAIERVEDGEHYFSDVVMGAVMGTVIGHSVASGRNPEFFGWKVLPYANPNGGSGVALMKTLP